MKFLCVGCDEPMKLTRTAGPDQGSMSVVFACPACGREIAMLTNSMETQMVRSLGVKIGASAQRKSTPMETLRASLASAQSGSDSVDEGSGHSGRLASEDSTPSNVPAVETKNAEADSADLVDREQHAESLEPEGAKCPFTGIVSQAFARETGSADEIVWTTEALERLDRIPSYVRGMVEKGILEYAKEQGVAQIDGDIMDEARGRFGM